MHGRSHVRVLMRKSTSNRILNKVKLPYRVSMYARQSCCDPLGHFFSITMNCRAYKETLKGNLAFFSINITQSGTDLQADSSHVVDIYSFTQITVIDTSSACMRSCNLRHLMNHV